MIELYLYQDRLYRYRWNLLFSQIIVDESRIHFHPQVYLRHSSGTGSSGPPSLPQVGGDTQNICTIFIFGGRHNKILYLLHIYFISTSLSCNSKLILLFADFCWFSNFSIQSPRQEFCPSWFSQSSTSEYTKGPDI